MVSNKGSGGIDGVDTTDLLAWLHGHQGELLHAIGTGKYKPNPARRVEIPKDGGKKSLLGIPTVVDRFVQQSISQILSPIYEREFSETSYGFRPNRSCHDALEQARTYITSGYRYAVDLDLEKFFATVSHSRLIALLSKRIKDGRVLSLIHRYLLAGVQIGERFEESRSGVPQGGNGWLEYFRLADMKNRLQRIDEWYRRRLRMCIWKCWKKVKTRFKNLLTCGIGKQKAWEWANTRKGYWRIADSAILHRALNNDTLRLAKYPFLRDCYRRIVS